MIEMFFSDVLGLHISSSTAVIFISRFACLGENGREGVEKQSEK